MAEPSRTPVRGTVLKDIVFGSGRMVAARGTPVLVETGRVRGEPIYYLWNEKLNTVLYTFRDQRRFERHVQIQQRRMR